MRKIFLLLLIFPSISFTQPKILTQAVIYTTTNTLSDNYTENPGDGQNKTVSIIKDDIVKTVFGTGKNHFVVYQDYGRQITTQIIFGEKSKIGFFAGFDPDSNLSKRVDSTFQRISLNKKHRKCNPCPSFCNTMITYSEETKSIAGYKCKKATIKDLEFPEWDQIEVWYTPEIKFTNCYSTSTSQIYKGKGMPGNDGFEKIDGFIMGYVKTFDSARKIIVNVTKIDTEKEITKEEVSVPKDYELKPASAFIDIINDIISGRTRIKKGKLKKK